MNPETSLLNKICVIVPTYNAASHWKRFHCALESQGIDKDRILVIDSSSTDGTADLIHRAGYNLVTIPKENFRHGGTRQMAVDHVPWAEFLVFLTQDAVCSETNSVANLLAAFDDPLVGCAYGRQLPRETAGHIERHARLYNYPGRSEVRDFSSRVHQGIKAAFFSNSFAAYRRSALSEVGGFSPNAIVCEDQLAAAHMLKAGWKIAYQADAPVTHSHPLTIRQEFLRYFDTGVQHAREDWLAEEFGRASGEGYKFVASQIRFLQINSPLLIPLALFRTFNKLISYQLGLHERYLPLRIKRTLSGQPYYWRSDPLSAVNKEHDVAGHVLDNI